MPGPYKMHEPRAKKRLLAKKVAVRYAQDARWHNDEEFCYEEEKNVIMEKKLTMQQKSERGRSERRVVAQTARKVRDKKEDAAIAKANAMLDEMMRDGTIKDIQKAKQEIMRKTGVYPMGGSE
jgi:hypothetical protein